MTLALSIVIPVHNEEALLEVMVQNVLIATEKLESNFELILVENGSRDRSARIAESLSNKDQRVRVIREAKADYGRALRLGLSAARGEWIANFSVDFWDMDFLTRALALRPAWDIVLGSKYLAPQNDQRSFLRRCMGHLFALLTARVLKMPFRDTHGLKLFRRSKVQELVKNCQTEGALFDNELIAKAHRSGLRICEIPLICQETRPSRSKNIYLGLRALIDLFKL